MSDNVSHYSVRKTEGANFVSEVPLATLRSMAGGSKFVDSEGQQAADSSERYAIIHTRTPWIVFPQDCFWLKNE